MATFSFKANKIEANALAYSNFAYIAPGCKLDSCLSGEMQFNSLQRRNLDISVGEAIKVQPFVPPKGEGIYLASLELEVGFMQTKKQDPKTYKAEQLETAIQAQFSKQMLSIGQELLADVAGTALLFKVLSLECVTVSESSKRKRGILMAKSAITFQRHKDSQIKIGGATKNAPMAFGPHFDFQKVGIGGLDKEFANIFRRAFASRVYPPEVVSSLGIKHVKGMLLYGPPGTGKTLIARKIGEMLNARPPKLVNGPEVLNKFVGQSEENVRNLFADAEKEYKEKGDESELHIIIFDEIDAICKERGSRGGGGTGVGDSVVNQLLSKMDGVEQVNNVLVIGMTNRIDMMDAALLRPGRLEVHMEISLPDEAGRVQILSIHTNKMRTNGYLGADVSIEELAKETKNYSGAEIEGLVKSATSFALNRNVDPAALQKPEMKKNITVMRQDFLNALTEVRPAFGAAEDALTASLPNGIITYGPEFAELFAQGRLFIDQVTNSARTPVITVLLAGKAGAGKTAFAAKLALESGFPYIKLLSPDHMIGYQESARVVKINQAFEDAYKSTTSLIILDDVERFLEYTPIGPRFSNAVLQAFIILLRKTPPRGRKLLVLATTSNEYVMREMGFMDAVNAVLHVPSLATGKAIRNVLQELGGFQKSDLDEIERGWTGEIEMKKLIMLAEMSKQVHADAATGSGTLGTKFLSLRKLN